jgi:hypothetical protein
MFAIVIADVDSGMLPLGDPPMWCEAGSARISLQSTPQRNATLRCRETIDAQLAMIRAVQVSIKTFTVTFPTEAGFIGRECNSSGCGRYFKVHEDSLRDHMHCPYCSEKFEKDQLYTKDQLEHAENQAAELAKEYMYGEIDKMFGNFASRNRSGLIKFTHTPPLQGEARGRTVQRA